MNDFGAGRNTPSANGGGRRLVITAQLYKAAATMSHIDQLFLWLANGIIQTFQAQVVQFWTLQSSRSGQPSIEMRASICQDPAFPRSVVDNQQVGDVAAQLLKGQYENMLQPVPQLFSSYQASTLSRFGLHFCSCTFIRSKSLLPPAQNARSSFVLPTPLAGAVLIFFRQPPTRDTLSAIHLVLEQAVPIAESNYLLIPPDPTSGRLPAVYAGSFQQQSPQSLYELIPQRKEDTNLMTSSNPLSGAAVISDKQARRLYTAINGVRNVKAICEHLRIDLQEAVAALRILAAQDRILLYEPGGQLIDSSVLVDVL